MEEDLADADETMLSSSSGLLEGQTVIGRSSHTDLLDATTQPGVDPGLDANTQPGLLDANTQPGLDVQTEPRVDPEILDEERPTAARKILDVSTRPGTAAPLEPRKTITGAMPATRSAITGTPVAAPARSQTPSRRMLEARTELATPPPRSPVPSGPGTPPAPMLRPPTPLPQLARPLPAPTSRAPAPMPPATTPMASTGPASVAASPAPAPGSGVVAHDPRLLAGRYEIVETLGEGAFGRVVAARDTRLGRAVALKLLHDEHAQNAEVRQRFLQEAHAAGCIGHPGVVTIFDVGELEGTNQPFIAMEMLRGESLQARVERVGPLPTDRVRAIGRQVASALAAAHAAGVTHRDLKPENLFVVADPAAVDGERIKVLDFGLAKAQLIAAAVKTRAGSVFGTPAYMSPEQFLSTRDTDHRSDIYSLGCILYHLATGKPPFEGQLMELVQRHRAAPIPSLRAIIPDASPQLDDLIRAMLAKEPADRPNSMSEIERELARTDDAPAPAGETATPERRRRWSLRSLIFGQG